MLRLRLYKRNVRVEESEAWLIAAQSADKQKAVFASYAWTPARRPRLRWTHPGSVFPPSCSCLKKRAAHQNGINSHYILSMQLQFLNDSVLPLSLFCQCFIIEMLLKMSFIRPVQLIRGSHGSSQSRCFIAAHCRFSFLVYGISLYIYTTCLRILQHGSK